MYACVYLCMYVYMHVCTHQRKSLAQCGSKGNVEIRVINIYTWFPIKWSTLLSLVCKITVECWYHRMMCILSVYENAMIIALILEKICKKYFPHTGTKKPHIEICLLWEYESCIKIWSVLADRTKRHVEPMLAPHLSWMNLENMDSDVWYESQYGLSLNP